MSAAAAVPLVSVKAVEPTDGEKKLMNFLGRQKEAKKSACDNRTPDLLISQLKFIHPGCR